MVVGRLWRSLGSPGQFGGYELAVTQFCVWGSFDSFSLVFWYFWNNLYCTLLGVLPVFPLCSWYLFFDFLLLFPQLSRLGFHAIALFSCTMSL